MPYISLLLGNCAEYISDIPHDSIDAVITDPPYPDYYTDEYKYNDEIIDFLYDIYCRQLIFWSARAKFPLEYSAIHIWDKKTGNNTTQYERIFERNGKKNYQMFRHYFINSTVAAQMTGDVYTGHKSQKPIRLMRELVEKFTNAGDLVLDPFMGSGSTGVACVELGRSFVGVEINEEYFEIAQKRIKDAQQQMRLPL